MVFHVFLVGCWFSCAKCVSFLLAVGVGLLAVGVDLLAVGFDVLAVGSWLLGAQNLDIGNPEASPTKCANCQEREG